MKICVTLLILATILLLIQADPTSARCAGLQGDALETCLKGEGTESGSKKLMFQGPDGRPHEFEAADVSQSMETVCKGVKQDGPYVAYRIDRGRQVKWKEVSCKNGKVDGLWKEYLSDEEMTTVLSYDATGKAVLQAIYVNGQLLKEQPLTGPSRR